MLQQAFDLIEYQNAAREAKSPKRLFELWEEVCRCYDRGVIGEYQLDEMKAAIWPNLEALSKLQAHINTSFAASDSRKVA